MKLNKEQLKRIINEELEAAGSLLEGQTWGDDYNPKEKKPKKYSRSTTTADEKHSAEVNKRYADSKAASAEQYEKATERSRKYREREKSEEEAKTIADKKLSIERGPMLRDKLFPYMIKNSKSLWEKAGYDSEETFRKQLKRLSKWTDERLAREKIFDDINPLLGSKTAASIVKGRSFLQKFGNVFKSGTFSEELSKNPISEMKLTKEQLKRIIKEELKLVMDEGVYDEPEPTSNRVQQENMRKQFINFVKDTADKKGISEGDLISDMLMSEGTGEGVFYDWTVFYKAKASVMKTYDIPEEDIPQITAEAIAGVMQTYLQDGAETRGRNAMSHDKIKDWVIKSHSEIEV